MTALLDLLQVRFVDRYGSVRFGVTTTNFKTRMKNTKKEEAAGTYQYFRVQHT